MFGLSDDHQQLRETIFNFAQKELAPHAQTIDKENNFAELRQFWRKLVRAISTSYDL
jgi:isovaleryl-CoA dehydrogenase